VTSGSSGWGGAWGTYSFIDPVEGMIGILGIQITSYAHINIHPDLGPLGERKIRGLHGLLLNGLRPITENDNYQYR